MSRPGELWIADMPFAQGGGSKRRPVLILWNDLADSVVAIVTTAQPRTMTDVAWNDWAEVGLKKASTIRLMRLGAVEGPRLLARVGTVTRRDAERLNEVWAEHLQLRL